MLKRKLFTLLAIIILILLTGCGKVITETASLNNNSNSSIDTTYLDDLTTIGKILSLSTDLSSNSYTSQISSIESLQNTSSQESNLTATHMEPYPDEKHEKYNPITSDNPGWYQLKIFSGNNIMLNVYYKFYNIDSLGNTISEIIYNPNNTYVPVPNKCINLYTIYKNNLPNILIEKHLDTLASNDQSSTNDNLPINYNGNNYLGYSYSNSSTNNYNIKTINISGNISDLEYKNYNIEYFKTIINNFYFSNNYYYEFYQVKIIKTYNINFEILKKYKGSICKQITPEISFLDQYTPQIDGSRLYAPSSGKKRIYYNNNVSDYIETEIYKIEDNTIIGKIIIDFINYKIKVLDKNNNLLRICNWY